MVYCTKQQEDIYQESQRSDVATRNAGWPSQMQTQTQLPSFLSRKFLDCAAPIAGDSWNVVHHVDLKIQDAEKGGCGLGGVCGGVKRDRFVILHFPLFYSIWGSKETEILGKRARKVSLSHPF